MSRRQFSSDQSGQVMTFFAFSLLPMIIGIGYCLDLQSQLQREFKTQAVLDSAVLAAAKAMQSGASDADVETTVADFVSFHIDSLPGLNCSVPAVDLPSDSTTIEASLECTQATGLMYIVGRDTVPVRVESTSTYALTAIDVAFIFDVSGSMNSGNRLVDLKSAVTDALDILLPSSASTEMIENTRIAMAAFNGMLNAGQYFEQVTGLPPTRSYTDTVAVELDGGDVERGRRYSEIRVFLYDADTGDRIAEIGDGAVVKVDPEDIDNITIVAEPKSSYYRASDFESIKFELSGEVTKNATESVEPYALYGDSGLSNLDGEAWSTGQYELELTAYNGNGATGAQIVHKTIAFELFKDGDIRESDQSYTLTSTCVWERDGDEKFTDAAPGPGQYLAAHSAWYRQYNQNSPAGYWQVGFNEYGERDYTGPICRSPAPMELTNNRTDLNTYVSTMRADGATAGHLGVAWGWYLISDRWSAIFDDTATPAAYTNSDIKKVVVLMTDGDFNKVGHRHQGDSATQAEALCDGMKDKGISIYGIAFKAPSAGEDVLKKCATNDTMFFKATSKAELEAAYKEIAVRLSEIRIAG